MIKDPSKDSKKIKLKVVTEAIERLESKLKDHPRNEFNFIPEDPAVKNGRACCLRNKGKEMVYLSKGSCVILNTQNGTQILNQKLPKGMIWGGTPRYKITGLFLSRCENKLVIFAQESYITQTPYCWHYDIVKNKVDFLKFKDPSMRLIHNHGFTKEIFFTMYNGCSVKEALFNPLRLNWKPEKQGVYQGLCLFKVNLVDKKVDFLMKLSDVDEEELAFQCVLDLKYHKKPVIWLFEQRLNSDKLFIKGISVVEKKINFQKFVEGFEATDPMDFQEGCDMMDYLSFSVCLEEKFQIFDLEFFESKYLYFEKSNRKTQLFSLEEDSAETKVPKITAIYEKSVEYDLQKKIRSLEKSKDFCLTIINDLVILSKRNDIKIEVVSHLISPVSSEESLDDYTPVQITYHLAIGGAVYCLNLIDVFSEKEIVKSLSNDVFCWQSWVEGRFVENHFFSANFGFFVSISICYNTGELRNGPNQMSQCSNAVVKDIEKFAGEVSGRELEIQGDPIISMPSRDFALFRLNGNFVVYAIEEKTLKWRSQFNEDLAVGTPQVYEFTDEGKNFYVAVALPSQINEGYVERRLYEYKGLQEDDRTELEECLLLDFEDYVGDDEQIGLQFFFFKEGQEISIYYLAKESENESCFVYCYKPEGNKLDAVCFKQKYLMSTPTQDYLKGDNFTIYPKESIKYLETDEQGALVGLKLIQLKEKHVWFFELPLEVLSKKSNLIFEEEEIECQIDWAGFRDRKFYAWVSFPTQQQLLFASFDPNSEKQTLLRWVETGFLKNEFRQRNFFYDDYAFQRASTSALYCFLRERYIEKNFNERFNELNTKTEISEDLDLEEIVDEEHSLYKKILKKIGIVFSLINIDVSYVTKNINILDILLMIDHDETMKKYIFYVLGPLARKKGAEFDNAIENFIAPFPDKVKIKKMIGEIFQS